MEAGQLFCGSCYGESYGATCGGCGSKIGGDQLWVEALDQQWHSHCFTCTVSVCVCECVHVLVVFVLVFCVCCSKQSLFIHCVV